MPPPPYRADQIGSLIRPQYLLDERKAFKRWLETDEKDHRNEADQEAKKKSAKDAEKKAIAEVILEQLKRGILPLSSGEFERHIFYGGLFEALDGLEMKFAPWSQFRTDFPTNRPLLNIIPGREVGVATGKVRHTQSAYLDDWLYVRSLLPEERWKDVKMTLPSPCWWHIQLKEGNQFVAGVYESDEEHLKDMSKTVRQEIMTLFDSGLDQTSFLARRSLTVNSRFVQIDDPNLTFFCDPNFVEAQTKEGVDLDSLLNLYIKSHNDVLADLPSDLRVGVHLCRGNFPGGVFLGTGTYNRISAKLFNELNYDLFYLEYDDIDRIGDFAALEHLPKDKAVVLGIVTTKRAELESLESLRKRVHEAADAIAKGQGTSREEALKNNLAVSPQCGFASAAEGFGINMTEDIQWQKLELLRDLSKEIWK